MQRLGRWCVTMAAAALLTSGAYAQEIKELKIGYQQSPIQDASMAMFETWGAKRGIKITKIPNSYGVYVEEMTASLTSNSDQYDVIWHNHDWGQPSKKPLEPMEDIPGLKFADTWGMDPIIFNNDEGKTTVVPLGHTFGVFFYRADLLSESELPKTHEELVSVSKRLQDAKKVKFGYVGAMAMNHTR